MVLVDPTSFKQLNLRAADELVSIKYIYLGRVAVYTLKKTNLKAVLPPQSDKKNQGKERAARWRLNTFMLFPPSEWRGGGSFHHKIINK